MKGCQDGNQSEKEGDGGPKGKGRKTDRHECTVNEPKVQGAGYSKYRKILDVIYDDKWVYKA